jgi:hypothetical protein
VLPGLIRSTAVNPVSGTLTACRATSGKRLTKGNV